MKTIIAYCGVDCSECDDYRNSRCPSCRLTQWKDNDICMPVKCCIEKHIDYCAFCHEFPCSDMVDFYQEFESHREAGQRMYIMKEQG